MPQHELRKFQQTTRVGAIQQGGGAIQQGGGAIQQGRGAITLKKDYGKIRKWPYFKILLDFY